MALITVSTSRKNNGTNYDAEMQIDDTITPPVDVFPKPDARHYEIHHPEIVRLLDIIADLHKSEPLSSVEMEQSGGYTFEWTVKALRGSFSTWKQSIRFDPDLTDLHPWVRINTGSDEFRSEVSAAQLQMRQQIEKMVRSYGLRSFEVKYY